MNEKSWFSQTFFLVLFNYCNSIISYLRVPWTNYQYGYFFVCDNALLVTIMPSRDRRCGRRWSRCFVRRNFMAWFTLQISQKSGQ